MHPCWRNRTSRDVEREPRFNKTGVPRPEDTRGGGTTRRPAKVDWISYCCAEAKFARNVELPDDSFRRRWSWICDREIQQTQRRETACRWRSTQCPPIDFCDVAGGFHAGQYSHGNAAGDATGARTRYQGYGRNAIAADGSLAELPIPGTAHHWPFEI